MTHRDLLRIWGKLQPADQVGLLALVGWLGGELILLLTVLIEEIDGLDRVTLTRSAAPTANFLPLGDQVMAETFFMLSSKGMMLPEYLSFIYFLNAAKGIQIKINSRKMKRREMKCYKLLIIYY